MKGYFGRLLRIDLGDRRFQYEEIPDAVLEHALGGKGLGVHLLAAETAPGVDPLNERNGVILATGPATGTKLWSQSRYGVFAKSPATGGYGESYCGGTLAPQLKGCGVDAVVLQGKAGNPAFLIVDEDGVRFDDATAAWGRNAFEAEDALLGRAPPGAAAMVIGPAGERLVRFACIKSNRWRSVGRGGMGAVFGVKNLKGIAFAGSLRADIADEELLGQIVKEIARKAKGSPATRIYQQFGTPNQVKVTNAQNCFPTRYWQSGHFPKWQNISADYMQQNFDVKACGCPTCFLRCTKKSRVKHGRHAGLELEGPEYETIYAIGGLNAIDSLEEIAYLNDLCDRLGLDTMSAGNMSAFAVEAYRRGKTDFAIDYNQPDRVAELFRLIAHREGVGNVLAQGIRAAAEELGLQDMAVHVKGLEPAGFDPRVLKGMGLSYATAARGACHLRGTFYKAELSGEIEKAQIPGKAELHIDYEDRAALFDCLILCRFYRDFIHWEELVQIFRALTGRPRDRADLQRVANRITQQTRRYNAREGLDGSFDALPHRFLREQTEEGASLSAEELQVMLEEYNSIRREREQDDAPADKTPTSLSGG